MTWLFIVYNTNIYTLIVTINVFLQWGDRNVAISGVTGLVILQI